MTAIANFERRVIPHPCTLEDVGQALRNINERMETLNAAAGTGTGTSNLALGTGTPANVDPAGATAGALTTAAPFDHKHNLGLHASTHRQLGSNVDPVSAQGPTEGLAPEGALWDGVNPTIHPTWYRDFLASGASAQKGAVPAPPGSAGTSLFLREDATWVAPLSGLTANRIPIAASATTIGNGSLNDNAAGVVTGLAGTALSLASLIAAVAAGAQAGPSLSLTGANAIAGSSTVGAAAGASINIAAGNAARLTSGDANGGDILVTPGAGIGTGAQGRLIVRQPGGIAGSDEIQLMHDGSFGLLQSDQWLIISSRLLVVESSTPLTAQTWLNAVYPQTVYSGSAAYTQWANSGTGITGGDGLVIGLNGTTNAWIYLAENMPLYFATNAANQMVLTAAGALVMASDQQFSWSSTTDPAAAADLGIKRVSAGIMGLTNGSTGTGTLEIGDGTAANPGLAFASNPDTGFRISGSILVVDLDGVAKTAFQASRLQLTSDTILTWSNATTDPTSVVDTGISRSAGNITRFGNGTATGAGGFSALARSPAQITANQNNYSPGAGYFQRWDASAAYTVTGMAAGVDGETRVIINVGTQNITLTDLDAASLSVNQWVTPTAGVSVVLAARQSVVAVYDVAPEKWRILT